MISHSGYRFGAMQIFLGGVIFLLASPLCRAQSASVAATPPMGWNSWNHFAAKVDDATIRAQADAMVSSGMRDAGYVYVNIDDTWEGDRDAQGLIHPNRKFPDMKTLADYVHSKGLKIGIYSSPGPKTCANFEGSYGHEEQDAETYAAWGIDYLKYDLCSMTDMMERPGSPEAAHKMMVDAYIKMRDALRKTGRPIVYSFCEYGDDAVWRWGAAAGANLWRTTGDIKDTYARMEAIGFGQAGLAKFAGPGHWNDPDMLEVGNGGMNADEYRTHMSLWAILAAPLLAGNDLSKMSAETVALLTNREVIAIDQDSAGKQGDRFAAEGPMEIWVRPLADGSKAVGLFNRHSEPVAMKADFRELGFEGTVKVRDIWAAKNLGLMTGAYEVRVPGHGVVLLRVSD
ncbi:MAG: glycoside hydrolase family 27 protein [Candidatus Acidiferrales bacterium]